MRLLVTRSYRKRRNDQPEDNSRDTAKDPLARMGSLAGLVVLVGDHRLKRPHGDSNSGRSSSQSERTLETELSSEAIKMLQTYVAWQPKIRKAHAMPLCGWSHFSFHGFLSVVESSRRLGAVAEAQDRTVSENISNIRYK